MSTPFSSADMVALPHASQASHAVLGFLIDYYLLKRTRGSSTPRGAGEAV